MEVSVIVPTYREAENLPELATRIESMAGSAGLDVELVVIDDDSGDGIEAVAASLDRPWIRLIVRRGRRGLSSAVLEGIAAARSDVIVVMDGDLSHSPEAIPALLKEIESGAEMVIGSRRVEGGAIDAKWGIGRRIASLVATLLARPLVRVRDPMSGFMAFRRSLIERCSDLRPIGFKIGLELMVRSGARDVRETPITFTDRSRGASKASIREGLSYLRHLMRLYWFALMVRPWRAGVAAPSCEQRAAPKRLLACAALTVLVVATVFGRSAGFGFLGYDDRFHVHENPLVTEQGAGRLAEAWAGPHGNLYVPLAYNLFATEASVGHRGADRPPLERYDPAVFHLTSIVLHAVSSVLVLLIVARLLGSAWGALCGALVFALHPLQVEAVAWVSEQRGLLASVLALGSALVYLRATDPRQARTDVVGFACAGLLFVVSMLAKPSSAPLPIGLLAIDVLMRGTPLRMSALRLGPWMLAALAILIVTRLLQPSDGSGVAAPLWLRPFIAGDALAWYLWKLVWPFGLTPDHGRTPGAVMPAVWTYLAWIVPAVLVAGALIRQRWRIAAGLIVFVAMLAPVLGLVTFHHQQISTVADRYAYLALFGVSIAAGAAFVVVPRRSAVIASVLIGGALGLRSWSQLGVWRDDITLWSHAMTVRPSSAMALNNFGYALYERGELRSALASCERALMIDPDVGRAKENAAIVLRELGRNEEAVAMLRSVLESEPRNARAMVSLGAELAHSGRLEEAASLFVAALEIAPGSADAMSNLGVIAMERGDAAEAERRYRAALEANPWLGEAWLNLGVILRAGGRDQEAVEAFERAIARDGPLAQSHQRLGDLLLAMGSAQEASEHLLAALRLDPTNAKAMNNLGMARLQMNDLDGAIEAFARAVELDPNLIQAQQNLSGARQLKSRSQGGESP